MPLSDIVTINISTETVAEQADGFGMPLILSANASFGERVRFYTALSGLTDDGFAITDPEYLAASAIFAQSPRVPTIAVGRLALPPTQRWAVTPVVANSTTYKMTISGNEVSFTSDASATATEIIAGLKTAIDALGLAVTTSDQTTYLRILANTAGDWFSVSVDDVSKLGLAQDHADPGAATDLAAIALEDSSWYGIINLYNSKDMAAAIAGWAESNKKLFVCDSQDSAIVTLASASDTGGSETIAKKLKTDARARTACLYHPENGDMAAAAWMGRVFATDPGKATWAFKTLSGVSSVSLTSTHVTNLQAKNCNYYYSPGSKAITFNGKVGAGEYVDVIRDRDWFESNLQTRIYNVLAGSDKLPFTDEGIAVVAGEVRAQLAEGIRVGFLAGNPEPTVTVPAAADVSAADKAARQLKNVSFQATLAGAIHLVTISGTISL